MEGQEPSSWGSIKLSCPWSGVLCGHWTSLGSKSLVCSSTKDLPLPPSAGGVAPEHSYPQIPGWPPLPSGSPCRDMAQNLPFSCIRFTHPWVFGNDGPRGTPILPLDIPAAEAQRVPHPSTWVTSEWQIQRTPPPVSWGFSPTGTLLSSPDTGPAGVLRRMKRRLSTYSPPCPGWEGRKDTQLLQPLLPS